MLLKVKHIWITNISKKDIMIHQFGIKIPSFKSIDLLELKAAFNIKDIENSINDGELNKLKKYIRIRFDRPTSLLPKKFLERSTSSPNRPTRQELEIVEENYEELNLSDEEYLQQI